jgi:hypothetical protein
MVEEDWGLIISFFPREWRELAFSTNALKGLRKDKSPEGLLRTLLIHLACGYSLRETAVRARQAELADLSDVALLKRLRKSKDWLYALCVSLFRERGVHVGAPEALQFRLFDATVVQEPGKTGGLWRIHYSIQVPSLDCDYFKITETQGKRTGEHFAQFPIKKGDYIIADRAYSRGSGIDYATSQGAFICVRVNTSVMVFLDAQGKRFPMMDRLGELGIAGRVGSWPVIVSVPNGAEIPGRLCAVRKSEEAIRLAHKKLRRNASKKGNKLKPETIFFAQYVILFTTFPDKAFNPASVLEWYRIRWQIELVFKRFKQIAQLGHLPKHDEESAKAWLYGKLFTALITEKIINHAVSVSPWGYPLHWGSNEKQMA